MKGGRNMTYHKRAAEALIQKISQQFPVLLLTGPRQVGKTTLLNYLFEQHYRLVTLDDPLLRQQIKQDPLLFFQNFS